MIFITCNTEDKESLDRQARTLGLKVIIYEDPKRKKPAFVHNDENRKNFVLKYNLSLQMVIEEKGNYELFEGMGVFVI